MRSGTDIAMRVAIILAAAGVGFVVARAVRRGLGW